MDVLTLSFTDIRRALLAVRTPPLEAVRSALYRTRTYLAVASTMRQVAPEKVQQALSDPAYLSSLDDVSSLEDQAVRLLSSLFPVHEIAVEEVLAEGESMPVIPIPCLNLAGSWDEFDEILQDPSQISESWSVIAFAHYFVRGIEGESWQLAEEHFHWPQAEAPELLSRADKRLDWERFTALLQENNLAGFEACFALAFWDTGSVFFDLDDEQLWNEAFEFNAETIHHLAEEWKKGEAVLNTALAACELANADPTLYFRLLDVLAAAVTEETTDERTDNADPGDDDSPNDWDDDLAGDADE